MEGGKLGRLENGEVSRVNGGKVSRVREEKWMELREGKEGRKWVQEFREGKLMRRREEK